MPIEKNRPVHSVDGRQDASVIADNDNFAASSADVAQAEFADGVLLTRSSFINRNYFRVLAADLITQASIFLRHAEELKAQAAERKIAAY